MPASSNCAISRPLNARASINCPHCGWPAPTRSSRPVTATYREIRFQCTNLECGHTFAGALSITHTIAPSACPNPAIDLPVAPPRRRAGKESGIPL